MFRRDKKSDLSDACVINAFKTCDETVQFRWYDHCREKMDRVTKKGSELQTVTATICFRCQ